jgi:hypothetical protein
MYSTGCLVACWACGTAAEIETTRVWDSTGIRIVENLADTALVPRAALDLVTEIQDREDSLEYDLWHVSGAVRRADGRVIVASGHAPTVRLFDANGWFLETILGYGSGPGEVRSPNLLWPLGADTLEVFDFALRRTIRFTASGALLGIDPLGELPYSAYPIGRLADGTLVGRQVVYPEDGRTSGPVERLPLFVLRMASGGSHSDTVLEAPGYEVYPTEGKEGSVVFPTRRTLEFGRETTVRVDRANIWVGTATRFQIERRDSSGTVIALTRLEVPSQRVTEQDIEADKARQLDNLAAWTASEQMKAQLRERIESGRYAEEFPPYERFFVDANGGLWVEAFRRPTDAVRRYLLFDPEGFLIGKVELPEGCRLLSVKDDHIVTRHVDADGLESVMVYRVDVGGSTSDG